MGEASVFLPTDPVSCKLKNKTTTTTKTLRVEFQLKELQNMEMCVSLSVGSFPPPTTTR